MSISRDAIVSSGLAIVDDGGPDALTMAAVAADLGVRSPSLYKHVRGLDEIRTLLRRRIMSEMTARFSEATVGRSGPDAVKALLHGYRSYGADHPHRYALAPVDPLSDPELAEAGGRQLSVVAACLRSYALTDDDIVHVLRGLRAAAHGFTTLETAGGFGMDQDVDESYARLIDTVLAGIAPHLRADGRS